jgi:hypothetical protein
MNVGVGTRPHSFISGNISFKFSVQCLCSAVLHHMSKLKAVETYKLIHGLGQCPGMAVRLKEA